MNASSKKFIYFKKGKPIAKGCHKPNENSNEYFRKRTHAACFCIRDCLICLVGLIFSMKILNRVAYRKKRVDRVEREHAPPKAKGPLPPISRRAQGGHPGRIRRVRQGLPMAGKPHAAQVFQ